ncbi:MAG: adenosylcobalamin-dependent ribonucleoside-diphosphate reductase, partial [Candidatus Thorarchaeota archaeon]
MVGTRKVLKRPTLSKRYTYEEAHAETLKYFFGADLPTKVFLDKYALRDKDGMYAECSPHSMHQRLAYEFARIDAEKYGLDHYKRYHVYLDAIQKFERIVPQGSPMAAVGNPFQLMSASNCVVVASPLDSMEGIFQAGEELAQLMKRRCGVGLDASTLRPEGHLVNNAAKTTSGAPSFCDFYSYVTRMVCQSGRRGALMLTMDVHHPDIAKFIQMKLDKTKVTGANISVRYSDEFMLAVVNDEEYEQRWPCESKTPKFSRMVKARDIWDLAVQCATTSAEPGSIFWNTMVEYLPAHAYPNFKTISTNPCSEIALSAYDSCRLISLNLTGYVEHPFDLGGKARFDFELFEADIALACQMSDNLVDLESECIDRIISACDTDREKTLWCKLQSAGKKGRRVGLGTHALGDMLAQLGLKYDTTEALEFINKLYTRLRHASYNASVDLAITRGPFPDWDWEIEKDSKYIKSLSEETQGRIEKNGRRFIAGLTNAPTGSVSLCSKTGRVFNRYSSSSGIEPLYVIVGKRRRKISRSDDNARIDYVDALGDCWQEYDVFHPNVQNYLDNVPGASMDNLPDFFVEAGAIDPSFRVRLQGVAQKYIDHSISSTINLPKGTSTDVVGKIYLDSWKHGLKGVTVYVDGSRDGVLLSEETSRPESIIRATAPKRPKELSCDIFHRSYKGQKLIALVGLINGQPYEFFGGHPGALSIPKRYKSGKLIKKSRGKYRLHIGKNGDSIIIDDIVGTLSTPEMGWTTRLISIALRHGTPIDFLVEQLGKDGQMMGFNKIIARVLKTYIKDGQKV